MPRRSAHLSRPEGVAGQRTVLRLDPRVNSANLRKKTRNLPVFYVGLLMSYTTHAP